MGSNFKISVSCHHFGWAFPSSGKSRVHESGPISFKTRFVKFPHRGETKKHPWDRILKTRFHATILGGLFQAAEKAGLTKVVQLRSKGVFSTFPILARQKKAAVGSYFTISVSCHHFGWAFPSSGKSRFDEGRQIALKTRFFNFPHRGETKKKALGSNFTVSVSCHHFGWAFPSSGKSRIHESGPIAFKTRFVKFPHRGETKKHPWDRILKFRFHATILGGLFQAAQNAGVTKVVEFRSKRVFSTFPIGAKRKNSLGIEFYNFGFMPPFWVGFSKQRKTLG